MCSVVSSGSVVVSSISSVATVESSVSVSIRSVSVGSVGTVVDSESRGVSASIVVFVVVVAGSVSEVADSSSISSSVTISVVMVGVVRGEVVGAAVVGRVGTVGGTRVGGDSVADVKLVIEWAALDCGGNLSGGTGLELGGGLDLGSVGGNAKKGSGESFHCRCFELYSNFARTPRLLRPSEPLGIVSLRIKPILMRLFFRFGS